MEIEIIEIIIEYQQRPFHSFLKRKNVDDTIHNKITFTPKSNFN